MRGADMSNNFGQGQANPNWKGGRTVTDHGYVLVKRPDHPDADHRGYVYEHRLVAQEKLGRQLKNDEQVHHKNGDKKDNRPENLEVLSIEEHRARHRESDDLRSPGEPNPTIECECGCGSTFKKYDDHNRPRKYVPGHNARDDKPSPLQDSIVDVLSDGEHRLSEIVNQVNSPKGAVSTALGVLREKDVVEKPGYGRYKLKTGVRDDE
ncbi:HNH-type endonuclease [Halobacterium phage phiH]|uniref:HNH-type endonuclease n=1 Tax=Halobacterium phage phiH TaxID=169684 RepID=A0A3G1ZKW2_BPPHH|nr:HNH endonuclease [Halobacterium phage phiH]AYM00319.1 HNH-type endonuclease [Halobacterium phage phiH]